MSELESGQRAWKATVSPMITGTGLPVYVFEAEVAAVPDGFVVVHKAGASSDLENWYPSRSAAICKAADEIERLIAPAISQVDRLRKEAGR
jgi:hypothetical protein